MTPHLIPLRILLTIALGLGIPLKLSARTQIPIYKDSTQTTESRVCDLLSRMTLEEKVGQLLCPLGWPMYEKQNDEVILPSAEYRERMQSMPLGGCWAVLRADPWTQKTLETGLSPIQSAQALNALQRYAVDSTRLGIPLLFAEEAAHGHMAIGTTVFPTAIGQASTFDATLLQQMGEAIALEVRSQGAHVGYGPVLDIARDPRWGRIEETFGEDSYLTSVLGSAMVRGMQGKDPSDGRHVYSTLKHFAAYGIPEAGLNGEQANIGWRTLLSEYVPQFRKAIQAGASGIMTSYNCIDGVPCTANARLLSDLLRKQWGFSGVVYSDLVSIEVMANTHHVFNDYKEAAAAALRAGVDIDLQGNAYGANLRQVLLEGLISTQQIDSAVSHVLRLKFRMGLFEHPYVDTAKAGLLVHSESHRALARQVAREGIILLKNDGILPLCRDIQSIAVIGPNADSPYNQLGDYTAPQDHNSIVTVRDGLDSYLSARAKGSPAPTVKYLRACAVRDTSHTDIAAAVALAKASDVTILVVGGSSARDFKTSYMETGAALSSSNELSDMETGEGMDRSSLTLMGDQQTLMQALLDANVPLVVIYIEGRPLDMRLAASGANALINAWYPGEQGGAAIADVLFGDYNPAGRLPVSIPRSVGQIPIYYSRHFPHDYTDGSQKPLYPFGYGLSYTTFSYSDLKIERTDSIGFDVSFTVANTGNRDGEEVPQLYLSDEISSVTTPPIALKGFTRIFLKAGESHVVTFHLGFEELSLVNASLHTVVEPGTFHIQVGPSSDNLPLSLKIKL